ncbi:MAG: CDP-diacylglycerol--glycerol-3-phosphate 3-phosphatidyltransferase [Desulfobacterales bacterium]|nr:CDP-diacylglycerol--glycerol-3-phosphate 3-phosphatidyltransferase [Desulfobacterales bacterium]
MTSAEKIKKYASHPNTLTMFRMAMTPAIMLLMLSKNGFLTFMAALLFSAAAITDYFDGYLARTRGLESQFGKVMDPLADKLLVCTSVILLTAHGWIPAWIVCIIIGREILVTGFRNLIADKQMDVSASWLGKYKTGFQIAAIIPLLIHYPYLGINFDAIGQVFLWGALIFTVWSGLDYFIKYRDLLKF